MVVLLLLVFSDVGSSEILLVFSDVGSSEIKLVHTNMVHNFPQYTAFIQILQIVPGMSLFVPCKLLPN